MARPLRRLGPYGPRLAPRSPALLREARTLRVWSGGSNPPFSFQGLQLNPRVTNLGGERGMARCSTSNSGLRPAAFSRAALRFRARPEPIASFVRGLESSVLFPGLTAQSSCSESWRRERDGSLPYGQFGAYAPRPVGRAAPRYRARPEPCVVCPGVRILRSLSGPYCSILMSLNFGGERGIRTPGRLPVSGFQDRRNRPLCHLSQDEHFTYKSLALTGFLLP